MSFWGSVANYIKEIPSANKELAKEAVKGLGNAGIKLANKVDADKIEKAVKAAQSLQLSTSMQDALATVGRVFSTVNTFKSAGNACVEFRKLLAASKKHQDAKTDAQRTAALTEVSISMLKTIESFVGVTGLAQGNIVKALANVGIAAMKMVSSYTSRFTWLDVAIEKGYEFNVQGYEKLALSLNDKGKSGADISAVISSLRTLKAAK